MTSTISTLSLFVLVLISGYLALPIVENLLWETSSLPFEHELTTGKSFQERTVFGDDFYTTIEPIKSEFTTIPMNSKRSSDESDVFTTVEPIKSEFTTIPMNNKRSSDESDVFTTVEYETTTSVERSERMIEDLSTDKSFTFAETTEEAPKQKREMLPFDEETSERSEINENEKRAVEPIVGQLEKEFTTIATELFTSTSSDISPKFYKHDSTEFSPIEVTTQKYVGSLTDEEEHKTHEKEEEHEDDEKHKIHEKEEEEERKPEKQVDKESDEKKDSKKKEPKSDKKVSSGSSEEHYVTGKLLDQDSSKLIQHRPNGLAVLIEPDEVYTTVKAELPEKQLYTTESTKLTQGKESTQTE